MCAEIRSLNDLKNVNMNIMLRPTDPNPTVHIWMYVHVQDCDFNHKHYQNAKMTIFFLDEYWMFISAIEINARIHAPRKTVLGAQVSFHLSNICLSYNVFQPVSVLNSCSLTAAYWPHQLAEHKVQIVISTYFTESNISLKI